MLDGLVQVWFVDCDRFFGRPGYYDFGGHEYGDNGDGDRLLASLARITGGRANPTPAAIYDPTATSRGKRTENLLS